jgi:hypothetical protein
MADQELQLVDPPRRESVAVADVDLMLQKLRIRRRLRKDVSANICVLVALMFERISGPEVVLLAEVVKDAP